MTTILRTRVAHAPSDPFHGDGALETFDDGAVAFEVVLLRPPPGSTLEAVLEEAPDWNAALGAVFTLAREESVVEVRVGARWCSPERASESGTCPK